MLNDKIRGDANRCWVLINDEAAGQKVTRQFLKNDMGALLAQQLFTDWLFIDKLYCIEWLVCK